MPNGAASIVPRADLSRTRALSLSLSSFLSSGQDGVHLTADPFVDRVPQFQRSAVAVCGPRVQFSSPVGTRSVDTPSTPDPHDMYVFEVRGVITCCIVCNTNKTEHLLGRRGGRRPRARVRVALPRSESGRDFDLPRLLRGYLYGVSTQCEWSGVAAPLPACSAGSARRRTPRTLRRAAAPRLLSGQWSALLPARPGPRGGLRGGGLHARSVGPPDR